MVTVRPSGFVEPCIPTRAAKPPASPGWVHEIKHDGYRLQVHRHGAAVRLFTRRGYDWSERYPAIGSTASSCARRRILRASEKAKTADGLRIIR
jgi:bifunctional non-homologous end joining protein LigD